MTSSPTIPDAVEEQLRETASVVFDKIKDRTMTPKRLLSPFDNAYGKKAGLPLS